MAVVGRPNVGKSTLVNALVGEKVAIVSDKPQTTRADIRAILSTDEAQIVFTDTPGFHKPRTLLGARLNELVGDAVDGVDVVILVVDAVGGGRPRRRVRLRAAGGLDAGRALLRREQGGRVLAREDDPAARRGRRRWASGTRSCRSRRPAATASTGCAS